MDTPTFEVKWVATAIARRHGFTPRETDVLGLLFFGMSYQEVGDFLDISFSTAHHYVSKMLLKSRYKTIRELMAEFYITQDCKRPGVIHEYLSERYGLTHTEHEMIRLLFLGWSNREIMLHMGISMSTVKAHVVHMLNKAGCNRREQLIRPIFLSLTRTDVTPPGGLGYRLPQTE